jgi:hypothetical protein
MTAADDGSAGVLDDPKTQQVMKFTGGESRCSWQRVAPGGASPRRAAGATSAFGA